MSCDVTLTSQNGAIAVCSRRNHYEVTRRPTALVGGRFATRRSTTERTKRWSKGGSETAKTELSQPPMKRTIREITRSNGPASHHHSVCMRQYRLYSGRLQSKLRVTSNKFKCRPDNMKCVKICPHIEMKLKQNSFKTVLKLFCFSFISMYEQFNTVSQFFSHLQFVYLLYFVFVNTSCVQAHVSLTSFKQQQSQNRKQNKRMKSSLNDYWGSENTAAGDCRKNISQQSFCALFVAL